MRKALLSLMSLLVPAAMMAGPIDFEKAKSLASPLMPNSAEPTLVKAATRNEAKSRTLDAETKSAAPYYIFSRGENQGFVIVSGDDCLPEILGYTESGNYDEELLPPHLLGWLDHYANLIEEAQANGVNTPNETRTRSSIEPTIRTAATKVNIDPLVTAHWHQSGPYNNRCPFLTGTTNRAVTGCVATAASQIIYYWRKDNPSTLLATTPTYDYGDAPVTESYPKGTPMKWELMLDSYNDSRPAEYDDAVATLNAAVGAATWLTYGNSTGGQISDLVNTFNSYFRMSSTCLYKDGQSQSTWENLIYTELSEGRPIVYTGYNDASGGHAVVLDGYKAGSNLFHFNFGWGGQGDGWYTVNDENGMNGFIYWQGMTYKIQPKMRNISAEIIRPDNFYINRTNNIRIKVNNNSTFDYSGIYLFMSTGSRPTSISSAKDEDVETIISKDGNDTYITLNCKPTLDRDYTLWITDENMNILATDTIHPTKPASKLQFIGMDIYGSKDIEKHNNEEFTVVYNNNKVTCEIEIKNIGDIDYEGSPKVAIYGSKDNGLTYEEIGLKTGKITIPVGKSIKTTLNISNTSTCPIETGVLYRGIIVNPITSTSSSDTLEYVNSDTIVHFVLREGEMSVDNYENQCLKLSGKWDYNNFITLSKNKSYKGATSYDLTAVSGLDGQPETENNPNALFYVGDDVTYTGKNIIKKSDSSCAYLALTAGHDFQPLGNINVTEYTLNINQQPNYWYLLTSPCTVNVPDGIIARQINSHSKTGITNKTTEVNVLEAGKTYLVMTSSSEKQELTSKNTTCTGQPIENTDTSFIGCYKTDTIPTGGMLLNKDENKFILLEEPGLSEGLRGYFIDPEMIRGFNANSRSSLDPKNKDLGIAIQLCYQTMNEYSDIVTEEANKNMSDSIAKAEKIFSSLPLTSSELSNYTKKLTAYTEEYKLQLRNDESISNLDCTDFIINPSFEAGSSTGWNISNKNIASIKQTSNLYYKGVGSNGKYLLNNLNPADSTGIAISQTIEGLTPGSYKLSAMVGSSEGNIITMFANDNKVSVDAHPFGKYYLTKASIDNIMVGSDGILTIGIEDGAWYKVDDFRLTLIESDKIANSIEESEIDDIKSHVNISPTTNGIKISTKKNTPISIYSISGVKVWENNVNGTDFVSLAPGIYIVNGKKVIIL